MASGNCDVGYVGDRFLVLVVELTGTKSQIVSRPLPTDDPKVRKPDITRARTMLSWEPQVALRDGVLRTIDYFRKVLG